MSGSLNVTALLFFAFAITASAATSSFSVKDSDLTKRPAKSETESLQDIDRRLGQIKKEAEAYKKQNEAATRAEMTNSVASLVQQIDEVNQKRQAALSDQLQELQETKEKTSALLRESNASLQLRLRASASAFLAGSAQLSAEELIARHRINVLTQDLESANSALETNNQAREELQGEMTRLQASQPADPAVLQAELALAVQRLQEAQAKPMQKQQHLSDLLGLLEEKRRLIEQRENPQAGGPVAPALIAITDDEVEAAPKVKAPAVQPARAQLRQNPSAPPGIEVETNGSRPVFVAVGGEVKYAGELRGFGQVAILEHPNAFFTVYAHLSRTLVREGAVLSAGEVLGLSGALPSAKRGWGVRFEVRQNDVAIDPQTWTALPPDATSMLVNGRKP